LQAVRVGDHRRHGLLLEGRHGADDENSGSAVAGDGPEITWFQAAEILGFTSACAADSGTLRGVWDDGLFDRRRGKASPKRVSLEPAEAVLELHREKYFDEPFSREVKSEHQIDLSYR
jgi:hypothetical protein